MKGQTATGPTILVTLPEGMPFTTVINFETHAVTLHRPTARTKYVLSLFGFTLIVEPVPTIVPPHDPLYQTHCAPEPKFPPDTESVVDEPRQIAEPNEL